MEMRIIPSTKTTSITLRIKRTTSRRTKALRARRLPEDRAVSRKRTVNWLHEDEGKRKEERMCNDFVKSDFFCFFVHIFIFKLYPWHSININDTSISDNIIVST